MNSRKPEAQKDSARQQQPPYSVISPAVSRLITVLRFPQIVLVVLRHNAGILLDSVFGCGAVTAAGFFITGLGGIFAYSALLLMFFLSGYLFWSREYSYGTMVKKKVAGLLFPYLIWNTLVFLFYIAGARTGLVQNLTDYYTAGENPLFTMLKVYTGWGAAGYPAAYPLWYLRDLMLLQLCSPLLAFCMKRLPGVSLCAFVLLWAAGSSSLFSAEGLLLFCLGWYAVRYDSDWHFLEKLRPVWLYGGYLLSMSLEIMAFVQGRMFLHKINVFLGSLVFLKLCAALLSHEKISSRLAGLSLYSFCIYLFHEPLLSVVRTVAIGLAGGYSVLLYLLVSGLVILACMAAGLLLKKLAPRLYRVLTGGR